MDDADLAEDRAPVPAGGPGRGSIPRDGGGLVTAGSQASAAPATPGHPGPVDVAGEALARVDAEVEAARVAVDLEAAAWVERVVEVARHAQARLEQGCTEIRGVPAASRQPDARAVRLPADPVDGDQAGPEHIDLRAIAATDTGGGSRSGLLAVSSDDGGDDAAFERFWSEVLGERPSWHRLRRRRVDRPAP